MPNTFDIGTLGMQAAGDVIGAGLGLALEHHNDQRQLTQQEKLQQIQIAGQKDMADYSYQKQLDMWNATSYPAQKANMEKAGLNPALLYGMSGGGGITTGTAPTTSVGSGEAPHGGHEIMDITESQIAQQQMQLQILQAQKANIEADTQNKEADTANKPKVGANIEASTASLTQGISNQKATQALTEAETNLKTIDTQFANDSYEDRLNMIQVNLNRGIAQLTSDEVTAEIGTATANQKIEQIKAEAVGAVINNTLSEAKIKNTDAATQQMLTQIQQSWQQLKNQTQTVQIGQQNADVNVQNSNTQQYNANTARLAEDLKMQITQWQQAHPSKDQVEGRMLQNMVDKIDKIGKTNYNR